MSEYSAEFVQIADLQQEDRQSMVDLYLSCYDGSDAGLVRQDLAQKTEVLLVRWRGQLVGFTTLQIYYPEWQDTKICVIFSGDTVIHPAHWGQQALAFNWISRAGQLQRQHPDIPVYWFLIVKGHRTFRYLPVFASQFYPHWNTDNPDLKALADKLASDKFGADYNPETGIVEFPESRGHLKPEIAFPDEREKNKPAVKFFLERNPGYMQGHEMVCLYRFDENTMKPLTRRLFQRDPETRDAGSHSPWQQVQKLLRCDNVTSLQESQTNYLQSLLNRNMEAEYGRIYRFGAIDTVADYQKQVPLVDYEDIRSYMDRIAAGEQGILFADKTLAFERTSGSSAEGKLIAYNSHSLKDFRAAVLPWLADLASRYDLENGCAYFAVSPAAREPETTGTGIPVGLPDGAYLGEDVLELFAQLSAVPGELAAVTDFDDWQLLTLYYLLTRNDLELFSVWSPTFLLTLLQALEDRASELEQLLTSGGRVSGFDVLADDAALTRFRIWQRTANTRVLWPVLKLISCWTAASSRLYAQRLRDLFPGVPMQGKGLLSTEGVVTVPADYDKPVLARNSGFFEFLDKAGNVLLAHELTSGCHYEVVITNNSGLYRYRTGDQVRCDGVVNDLPVLTFTGRIGMVSDLVGEKLTENFVADCISFINGFAMLLAEPGTQRAGLPGYLLLLDESDHNGNAQLESQLQQLEQALKRNPHYAYARKLGQLKEVETVTIQNPLQLWLDYRRESGAVVGDIKVSALSADAGWLARVLAKTKACADQSGKRAEVFA